VSVLSSKVSLTTQLLLTGRKVRCGGGAPCKSCQRASRTCDYEPVPDEVNKATREKKAAYRSARQTHSYFTPSVHSTSYYVPFPPYDSSYVCLTTSQLRPMELGQRRSSPAPNFNDCSTVAPIRSVALPSTEDTGMQQGWFTTDTAYPCVLEPMPEYQGVVDPHQVNTAWCVHGMQQYMAPPVQFHMPATPLNSQAKSPTTSSATLSAAPTLSSSATPEYYAPSAFHTPFAPSLIHGPTSVSPTLHPVHGSNLSRGSCTFSLCFCPDSALRRDT
jgi:hypothetical protein